MEEKIVDKIERKIPWGVIGVTLTILFGFVSFYTYFNQIKPNIQYEVLNESNVLDIHKPLDNLTILLNNENIQEKNLNLKLYNIKVNNIGFTNILQEHFDKNIPWGIKIENGKLINQARLINSNSKYLSKELKVLSLNNSIEFSKIILEQDKYFIIELLVLHEKKISPILVPTGKIVGIENIPLVNNILELKTKGFFDTIIDGGIFINAIRFVIFFIIFILIVTIIVKTLEFFDDRKTQKEKERKKENLINILNNYEEKDERLFFQLLDCNIKELELINSLCSKDNEVLKSEIAYLKKENKLNEDLEQNDKEFNKLDYSIRHIMDMLLNKKLISYSDTQIDIDEDFVQELNRLIDFKKVS